MRLRRGAGERKVGGRDVNGEATNAERRNKMLNIIKSKRSYIGNKPRSRQTTKRRGRGAEGTRQERHRGLERSAESPVVTWTGRNQFTLT